MKLQRHIPRKKRAQQEVTLALSQQPNSHQGLASILVSSISDHKGVLGERWLIHYPGYGFNESEIRLV